NWFASTICIILLLLYRISIKPLRISVSTDNLYYATFPIKILKWQRLNNVILKDDILTIDFKNDKILQVEIENDKISINEKEFNDFCRQQLKAGTAAKS